MNKIERMAQLMREQEEKCSGSIAAMFGVTKESADAFGEMWDYAKANGFVHPNGHIMDRQFIEIYKNYGCLGAEKRAVYTYGGQAETAVCSDTLFVKIPEGWELDENIMGEKIVTDPYGENWTINQVLGGDEIPYLMAIGHGERYELAIL